MTAGAGIQEVTDRDYHSAYLSGPVIAVLFHKDISLKIKEIRWH